MQQAYNSMKRDAVNSRLVSATVLCIISTLLRVVLLNLDVPEDRLTKILKSDLLIFLAVLFVMIYGKFYPCVAEHASSVVVVVAAIQQTLQVIYTHREDTA